MKRLLVISFALLLCTVVSVVPVSADDAIKVPPTTLSGEFVFDDGGDAISTPTPEPDGQYIVFDDGGDATVPVGSDEGK